MTDRETYLRAKAEAEQRQAATLNRDRARQASINRQYVATIRAAARAGA